MLTEPDRNEGSILENEQQLLCKSGELVKQLKQNQLKLFEYLELPLAHCIAAMNAGIRVNTEQLSEISQEFDKRLNDLRSKVHSIADKEFNLNSVVELQEVLYEKFKLHEACGIKPKKIKLGMGSPRMKKLWRKW